MSPPLVKKMKAELAGCKISGATIHFSPDQPLPSDIVTTIVSTPIKENEALAALRKKAK